MIEIAQWDTDHFGFKIGNLYFEGAITQNLLDTEIEQARREGYDLLYLKGVTLPQSLLNEKVILADEKVLYTLNTIGGSYVAAQNVTSYLNHELDAKLLALALQSGGHSRYYLDKNLPMHVFLTLYQIWIEKSLDGTIASDVLVYKEDESILGLLSYKMTTDKVVIGLVAVDKTSTGKGIGTKLMQTFLSKLPSGTRIEVATQKCNAGACRYYEKNGFEVENITNVYHLWVQ